MARFYASIQGNRGEATRMGTESSGIMGHVRGWDIGARIDVSADDNDCDEVEVSVTRGSNGGRSSDVLLTITQGREPLDGPEIVLANTLGMRAAAYALLQHPSENHDRPLSHKQF